MNSDNSEYKIGGVYTLAEGIRALGEARRLMATMPRLVNSGQVMIVRAIAVDLGALERDVALLNWFDTKAEEHVVPNNLMNIDREYIWRIGQHVTIDPTQQGEPKRMHVRELLRTLREHSERYPNARMLDTLDARIDTRR